MADWTRDVVWRQGQLLAPDAVAELNLTDPESLQQTVAAVATHDCDLVQPPDREPLVELVLGRVIDTLDGNYTHAKASRTLHIAFDGKEKSRLVEFSATGKRKVTKEALADCSPDPACSLSPENRVIFQRWLASRYHRAAFPDEFEKRLKESGVADRLKRAVRPHCEHITAVLMDVDEGQDKHRQGPEDVYILDIYLLHAVSPDYSAAELAANRAKDTIRTAFEQKLFDSETGAWKNVELRYIDVISEEALTYRQFTLMKRWRLDHLSLGTDPQGPITPE